MFKKLLGLAAALTLATPALAKDPDVKFYTPEATGCMILRECKEGVKQVFSLLDVSSEYDNPERYTHVAACLLYTSPSPRDVEESRMPSSA